MNMLLAFAPFLAFAMLEPNAGLHSALVAAVVVAADLAMLHVAGFTPIFGTIAILAALGGGALVCAWISRRAAYAEL